VAVYGLLDVRLSGSIDAGVRAENEVVGVIYKSPHRHVRHTGRQNPGI